MATARSPQSYHFLDCLYGPVSLSEEISILARAPLVQRLRHVRLSNIDSLGLPGIAGLSRFEHVLGTSFLATQVGLAVSLTRKESLALQAAALLHDWAITAFGHLVEEAFAYVGSTFHHEDKLLDLVRGGDGSEIGGVNRQVLRGRETGLVDWCREVFSSEADKYLSLIVEGIVGERKGKFGRIVSGDIDLDNIDNLHRIAFHMGLEVNKSAPLELAKKMRGVAPCGSPVFAADALGQINEWVQLRRAVYTNLMLTQPDFAAKLMVLSATVAAMKAGEFDERDWSMTDGDFVHRLSQSKSRDVKETVDRWITGELWDMAPLTWMSGSAPSYPEVLKFSDHLSQTLGRRCFAYRIKDKRERELKVFLEDGQQHLLGHEQSVWLLGVGSPMRRAFSPSECAKTKHAAEEFFGSRAINEVHMDHYEDTRQESLL